MEKDIPCNTMKAGMAILVSGKVDFSTWCPLLEIIEDILPRVNSSGKHYSHTHFYP